MCEEIFQKPYLHQYIQMQSDKSNMPPTPPKSYSTTQPANSSGGPFAIASNPATQSTPHEKNPHIKSEVMEDDDCCRCDSGNMKCCGIIIVIFC